MSHIIYIYLWTDPDLCCFTFFQALPIILDVIKQAPTFGRAYHYLSLVYEKLGRTDSLSTGVLRIAATVEGPKSPCWKLLYERSK